MEPRIDQTQPKLAPRKSRFQIDKLEERIAPSLGASLLSTVSNVVSSCDTSHGPPCGDDHGHDTDHGKGCGDDHGHDTDHGKGCGDDHGHDTDHGKGCDDRGHDTDHGKGCDDHGHDGGDPGKKCDDDIRVTVKVCI